MVQYVVYIVECRRIVLMNKVFSVLGGISAILLLGSFFLDGFPQDAVRLLGSILLITYCAYKIMRSSKDDKSN